MKHRSSVAEPLNVSRDCRLLAGPNARRHGRRAISRPSGQVFAPVSMRCTQNERDLSGSRSSVSERGRRDSNPRPRPIAAVPNSLPSMAVTSRPSAPAAFANTPSTHSGSEITPCATCSANSERRSCRARPYTFSVRSGVAWRARACVSFTDPPASMTELTYATLSAWESSLPASVHFSAVRRECEAPPQRVLLRHSADKLTDASSSARPSSSSSSSPRS